MITLEKLICEEFDLIKLMTVNCDFDVQLIISSMLQSTSALMRNAISPSCAVMSSFMSHGALSAMLLVMRIPGLRIKVALLGNVVISKKIPTDTQDHGDA